MDSAATPTDCIDIAGQELLSRLLSAASEAIVENPGKARSCITRAAAFLQQSSDEPRCAGRRGFVYRGGLAGWQARKLALYVQGHLREKICVADLAREAQLSASHLSRAFKDTFGEAPMLYVARRRIKLAQRMILRTAQPLAQIADTCGLPDQAHFTRVFKQIVGTSPRAWRRQFSIPPDAMRGPADASGAHTGATCRT